MFFTNLVHLFAVSRRRPQKARRAVKASLHVEGLEQRDVPAVLVGPPADMPILNAPQQADGAKVALVAPTDNAALVGQQLATGANAVGAKASLASPTSPGFTAAAAHQYTAITIRNNTTGTVNYSYRWTNGTWKSFSLAPGQSRVHFIRSLSRTAQLSYDRSFASGIQEQRYTLTGNNIVRPDAFYLREATPGISEGRLYTFGRVTGGIQLYS